VLTLTTAYYGPRAVGGADEYGYASQAELWLQGRLTIDQSFVRQVPWPFAERAFAPLGYRPHPRDRGTLVPTYSPGLPMLLAAAKRAGGQEALFFVVPIAAGLLVLATFRIGSRLGSPAAGLSAAWLVATSPTVLFMSMATMSDVPAAAAWACALTSFLGRGAASAGAAGLFSSIAILIRPNLAPLAAVLVLGYLLLMRDGSRRREAAVQAGIFTMMLVPAIAGISVLNARLYGSPLTSGYGELGGLFAAARVPENLRRYLAWLSESHTPIAVVGLVAIFVPWRRIRPPLQTGGLSVVIALFVAAVWAIYCAWLVFDAWWFTRFLLSSWPFIMLSVGSLAVSLACISPRFGRPIVVAAMIALGVYQVHFASAWQAFGARDSRRRFVAAAQLVRWITGPNSVVLSKDHNGSIRYYGGRMTLDYAWMPRGAAIDASLAWLENQGVPAYLAIEDWELPEVRALFAGSRVLLALDRPPLAISERPGRMLLFDLREPRSPEAMPAIHTGSDIGWRAAPPVPLPQLAFRDQAR
jgi:hypothetical protein